MCVCSECDLSALVLYPHVGYTPPPQCGSEGEEPGNTEWSWLCLRAARRGRVYQTLSHSRRRRSAQTLTYTEPRVHRGEFLRGDVPRCVPFPGSPPQDPITETPLPNVIQETEPPSSLPSSPPPLLISFPPLLSEDPQTSTDPLPLLPEDPANIALFVDVSPSADLLNVLPHVDASNTRSHPPPEIPHPFSTAAPTLKVPLSTALTGVPVCVTFQFYTPEPEPEPRGDSK
ncbi:hypothetical protein NQZ68_014719 [Dissostichus eleginoides]|nr:hypothetical protein NQZ68_014719 [Dissostichus eleginoides]